MSFEAHGNTKGLSPSERKAVSRLSQRRISRDELVSLDLAREMLLLSERLRRKIAVLIDRQGNIAEVMVGTKEIVYLPDLGRYRLGPGRLRNLRLVFTDVKVMDEPPKIPSDIYGDLEKLRLDMVAGISPGSNRVGVTYAHLIPSGADGEATTRTEYVADLGRLDLKYDDFIKELEAELAQSVRSLTSKNGVGALLVGVYEANRISPEESMAELRELARTAGVTVAGEVVQRRRIDPKTFMGSGKLEEVVLRCLRLGADMLIFDTELKPSQWRSLTNSTELKVLDRSMLILDIFAQRAQSSEGRLQVELAQLRYNLPRLVEKDAGLSRLSGGIGGRGPGETKLEIGRRRIRDRISEIEKRIGQVRSARELRRTRRRENMVATVAIIGYTNVGKSTLFNALTGSNVLSENKLFATLDPSQRRLYIPAADELPEITVVVSDTVGFIRQLPTELENAFQATLEELYDAALLLHVIDASDPGALDKYNAVRAILERMELSDFPELVVVNKIDKADAAGTEALIRATNGIAISASCKLHFGQLLSVIRARLARSPVIVSRETAV